ncbi:hypothetical protein ACF1AO_37065 [Streptomyces longwoodensis]|uniref:hypothetical protein n=1 Tax=Streptomyces longwoodensis TaxID=68231 RepID=UPI0036FD088F
MGSDVYRKYGDRLSDRLISFDEYNKARERGGVGLAAQEKSVITYKLWITSLMLTLAAMGTGLLFGMLSAQVEPWAALVFTSPFLLISGGWGATVAVNVIKHFI